MPIDPRFKVTGVGLKRDVRPLSVKTVIALKQPWLFSSILLGMAVMISGFFFVPNVPIRNELTRLFAWSWGLIDLFIIVGYRYFKWYNGQLIELPLKLPMHAGKKAKDKNNPAPNGKPGKAEGILFLGNVKDGPLKQDEIWMTNSDARTHMLFLGTTGAGKSEGLKSLVTNAFCWGSGFVYVDGKAQNTLWGDIYSLARRFGRDDDVLVLNYMTGNSDNASRSNTLNPFSIGSASYLTQMMVGLMDDSGDDNAMWKGRAISLMSALMPALTWKRDNQGLMLDVGVIRDNLTMQQIIKMSRDPALPDRVIRGLQSYLDTLPGYVDSAFDDEGNERPPTQDQPMVDLSQTRQQHGYLTMQFTRALSSLADEYGYIFKQQLADIDMMDVVLNRRVLVVLIPALEKSPDEAANLGKIVVAALKGMMGATLGAELEGEQTNIIDNNPTTAASPFMTVFDEVGYYTSPGMGVMAAQARSLGFSLIFAGQDMPALQKRVKEEALSITGNCNLKIFGKLEDPTETKDFFEKTVSSALVSEASGFSATQGAMGGRSYYEGDNITFQARKEASYDDLKRQQSGQVHFLWAEKVIAANMFYANPKRVNVVRVQRFLAVSPRNWAVEARDKAISDVTAHLRDPSWRAGNGAPSQPIETVMSMADGYAKAAKAKQSGVTCGAVGVASIIDTNKRRSTEAVSAPGVGTTGGHWPFGPADGAAPGAPPQVPTLPGANTPPWMVGAPPAGMPPAGMSPVAGGSTPPWLAGAGAGQLVTPTTQKPPLPGQAPPAVPPQGAGAPPWAGAVPQRPPATPPYGAPPAGGQQQFGWGNIMGAAPGMGTPPGGAQVAQANPVAPPPSWMAQPAALPPQQQATAPWAGMPPTTPYGAPPQTQSPPPWAGAVPVQPPVAPYGAPPQQTQAPPPWAGAVPPVQPPQPAAPPAWAQQPQAPVQPQPYAPPPAWGQPPVQPPAQPPVQQQTSWSQPAAAPSAVPPAQQPPAWARPQAPMSVPPGQQQPPEVEAILRSAAQNLSGEMFQTPPKSPEEGDEGTQH